MTTITFDTLKFVKQLEASGVPPRQAEAFVNAQREILADVMDSTLATRSDVLALEKSLLADINKIEKKQVEHDGEFKTVKLMMGIILGGIVTLILKAFFPI